MQSMFEYFLTAGVKQNPFQQKKKKRISNISPNLVKEFIMHRREFCLNDTQGKFRKDNYICSKYMPLYCRKVKSIMIALISMPLECLDDVGEMYN
jgi:hypothetical protein